MRTQDEIGARVGERQEMDMLGFEWHEYLPYLDFEHAKEYLKPEITTETWSGGKPIDVDALKAEMIDYVPFAWEKANGFRGISASRSLSHFLAWFWLLGENEMVEMLDSDYEFYGKDQLRDITGWLGLDPDKFDDGVRQNEEY